MVHMPTYRAVFRLTVFAMAATILSGCIGDPVRTTQQGIRLEITDSRGLPAPGVRVKTMESWESWQTRLEGMPESKLADAPENWRNQPWLVGMTDVEGNADIVRKRTGIDGSIGRKPPAKLDSFSNREYIIKVEGQSDQEELRVVMKPGAVTKGKWYTVTVKSVEAPRYVSGWKN